jgi:Flp pilus assembly protein TadD
VIAEVDEPTRDFQIRARQFDSAAAVVARMVRGSKESEVLEIRGYAYAMQGDTAAAQRTLGELQRVAATRYVSPFTVARIYAALGDRTQAMRWLERGYSEHASEMFAIKVDPVLDALRSDIRFTQLVKRMRLE